MLNNDISATNIALFGTDIEYKIKRASAEGEPEFRQFIGGATAGTYLWRIHDFKLECCNSVPAMFFRGDSYLALDMSDRASIFYWIGSNTTLDEAGTAAYKAFELDNVLGTKAVQYREVCGSESEKFLSLFPSAIFLDGGFDSGFNHVTGKEYKNRLLQVYEDHTEEVPMTWKRLVSSGAFILDCGLTLYQWIGATAPAKLKASVMKVVRSIDNSRGDGVNVIVLTENTSEYADFMKLLGGDGIHRNVPEGDRPRIVRYQNGSFSIVNEIGRDAIYIVDNGTECTVYGELPLASFCTMAYFTWAGKKPLHTRFLSHY